ncbi:hypothetical protein MNBD_BACTEROID06-550 [hydrothermal vent metagenome]|uniref:Uncharacterized protein n=1 Tax=hydrothermal vent metagenome TaxID=652676 RepID=A0A3B0UCX7_9ZZZZ
MAVKYSKQYLNKLEDLMAETDFILRYEKGNFKSGYCILNSKKIAIINKYFTHEGKINCIIDIVKSIEVDTEKLSPKNQTLFLELSQTDLEF